MQVAYNVKNLQALLRVSRLDTCVGLPPGASLEHERRDKSTRHEQPRSHAANNDAHRGSCWGGYFEFGTKRERDKHNKNEVPGASSWTERQAIPSILHARTDYGLGVADPHRIPPFRGCNFTPNPSLPAPSSEAM